MVGRLLADAAKQKKRNTTPVPENWGREDSHIGWFIDAQSKIGLQKRVEDSAPCLDPRMGIHSNTKTSIFHGFMMSSRSKTAAQDHSWAGNIGHSNRRQ